MTPQEMKARAQELLGKGFHCSQAVLAASQEKLGMVNKEVVRALGGFGGGFAGTGYTCGCMAGGMAIISSLYSKGEADEKEDVRLWKLGRLFVKEFEKLTAPYGGVTCKHITGVDWTDREQVKKYYSGADGNREKCLNLAGETARILGEIFEQADK
jgi:C_GCAxxG_C_C family probable redox protein